MKIHVSNLTTRALDYAVAIAIGEPVEWLDDFQLYGVRDRDDPIACDPLRPYSSDWAVTGPLLERHDYALPYKTPYHRSHFGKYESMTPGEFTHNGHTPLDAFCRAIVASKLGEWVDVPDDLVSDEDDA